MGGGACGRIWVRSIPASRGKTLYRQAQLCLTDCMQVDSNERKGDGMAIIASAAISAILFCGAFFWGFTGYYRSARQRLSAC